MQNSKPAVASLSLKKIWQKRFVRIIAYVVIFAVVIVAAFRIGVPLYMEKWFLDNGADVARVEKARLNPFKGAIAFHGVHVEKGGVVVFSNATLYFDIGLGRLFSKEAYLQSATLAGVVIDIERYEDGSLRIGPYPVSAKSDTAPPATDPLQEAREKVPWIFRARKVDISDVTFRYRQPGLNLELIVETGGLSINTDPDDDEGFLNLKGTLNGAPIDLNLSTLVIAPDVKMGGAVNLSGLKLDMLANLLKDSFHPFTGTADIQGKINFAMPKDAGVQVEYDGGISLQDTAVTGKGWSIGGALNWDGAAAFKTAGGDSVVEMDGRLSGRHLAFAMPEAFIDVDTSEIDIEGKTRIRIAKDVVVDSGASLKLAGTSFATDTIKTESEDLSWEGRILVDTGSSDNGLQVEADGKLQVVKPLYGMKTDTGEMQFSDAKLSWNGRMEYGAMGGVDRPSRLKTDGDLTAGPLSFLMAESLQFEQDRFSVNGKSEIFLGKPFSVSYTGAIALDNTRVQTKTIRAGKDRFTWEGRADYTDAEGGPQIRLAGDLKAQNLSGDLLQEDVRFSNAEMGGNADFILLLKEKPSFSGRFTAGGKQLQIQKVNTPLFSLDELRFINARDNGSGGLVVDSIDLDEIHLPKSDQMPLDLVIPSITLSGLKSPDLAGVTVDSLVVKKASVNAEPGKVTLTKLDARDLNWSARDGFACEEISLDSLFAEVVRQKSKAAGKPLQEKTKKAAKKEDMPEAPTDKKAKMPIRIHKIDITGDSGLKFSDQSLTATFALFFALDSLQVRDIDSTKPEQPLTYELKGTINKYSPLKISGTCTPFADLLVMKQDTKLQNYSMPNVSPYVVESIGVYFKEGILDFTSALRISGDELDMKNNLVMKDLFTETIEGEAADHFHKQLPIPLNLALSMLRDSSGTIDLDVPIRGRLSEMNVGLSDIIVTVLSKAISVAVAPYLAYTVLGPTGALVYLGTEAALSLMKTNLPSFEFEKGATTLSDAHKAVLQDIGKTIEKDGEKDYSICAKVAISEVIETEAAGIDRNVLQNEKLRMKLFQLGEARAMAVKNFLVSGFAIDEKRLLICQPGILFEEGKKSAIEFKN